MPNKAVNQLTEATEIQDGDVIYVVRGTTDRKVDASTIAGRLLKSTTTILTGQVATLFASPVNIVEAPDADQVIVPVLTVFRLVDGGTDWTVAGDLEVISGTSAAVQTGVWNSASDTPGVMSNIGGPLQAGQPLRVKAPTSNPTGGDYNLVVECYYTIANAN